MTSSMIDDAISLRFHLARSMAQSPYAPEPRSAWSFMWRSRSWYAFMVLCDLFALWALLRGHVAALALIVLPKLATWLYDRRSRRTEADYSRPHVWEDAAYEISRHMTRPPCGSDDLVEHGLDVLVALNRARRSSSRLIDARNVAAMIALANATTARNRMLILSSLQLTLLAHAERLRVYALHDSDVLEESTRLDILRELARRPHRGRRPLSLGSDHGRGMREEI